ncbi:MAG: ABC transporter substrate-binding protein [Bdellovibrionia bacterium]
MSSISRFRLLSSLLLCTALIFSACTKKSADPANTVRLSSIAKFKGLDPIQGDDLYSATEASRAYETLLDYHYLKRPYVLIPLLAESMPEVSKDGKTYTFKLKKGVLFHDDVSFKETQGKGREMTADDVIYSWKRLADPKNTSPNWWTFEGKIVGLDDWHNAAAKGAADYSKPIEGLKAIDRYTLQVTLNQPNSLFLYMLAMPSAAVVPHEAVEHYGKEFLNHAVGTGPYRLTEFNPNSKAIWDRNPTYRKELYPSEGEPGDKEAGLLEDAGKPLPLNDRIIDTVYEEQQPQWLTFLSGKLDVSGIPKDNFAQAIDKSGKELTPEMKAKNLHLGIYPSADLTHLSFNMADPLMGKNKYLRQALSLAYDSTQLIDLFYNGRAIPAQGPIPPMLAGYDPAFKNPYRQYNLEKAKELLAKAGYPGGKGLPTLDYVNLSDSTSRQFAEYTQKAFSHLGVQLKVSSYSWPEFQAKIKNKQGQMWEFAWNGDYPDAENFLQLFYGKNVSPGPNDGNYVNPAFDKLYEKSLTLTNEKERLALYKQMVDIVVEDTPWIFGVHRTLYYLTQPWTKNYKYNNFSHSNAKHLRIDTALKK